MSGHRPVSTLQRKSQMEDLVTGADVGRRLEVSRERVRQLAQREDFPAPIGKLAGATIWRWSDVERWAQTWDRRPGRRRNDGG